MRRKLFPVMLLVVVTFLVLGSTALAQDKTLYWQRYDVDIAIQKSGDLRVQETQELVFTSGTFKYGEDDIDLSDLSGITDVGVSEQGGPTYTESDSGAQYTYSLSQDNGQLAIRYNFPPSQDSRRTIVLAYTVSGALRYYPQNGVDQLDWKAIEVPDGLHVESSTITLHAPPGATFTNYTINGASGQANFQKGQTDATIVVDGPLNAGADVEAVAEWPHGIVAGSAQPWQQQVDAAAGQQAQQQQWGPVFTLGLGGLGLLILVGGPLLLYLWWYRMRREHPIAMIADYLPEPPSDLPAGMVGVLVNETADMQDIIGTLLDLARRGAVEIQETDEPGFMGIGEHRDFIYRLKDISVAKLKYESTLLHEIFGSHTERKLSDLANKFYAVVPTLQRQMYDEAVGEGFFSESPEGVRKHYGCLGFAVLAIGAVAAFVLLGALGSYTAAAVCPGLALVVVGAVMLVLARRMPRRTDKGVEANARWLAFKRYLQNLEKYTKVEDAAGIFEHYLPYAVVFGLERSWIQRFSAVQNVPAPTWWIPFGVPRPYLGPGLGGPAGAGHAGPVTIGGDRPVPSLSDMSRGMGTSLSSMSTGLGAMLSSASHTLTSQPAPSGGSGGRGFGGGGRGFGGGGFSGGGGFHGGGGGGGHSHFR